MSGVVDLHRDGPVAAMVLRHPARRNAISATMWRQISEIAGSDSLSDARCLVIQGEGDAFSAGADITGFDEGRSGDGAVAYDDLVEETVRRIEALPIPSIAAIAGPCIGAGASLACGCDLRVAEETAFFAVPAAKLGLGYDPRGLRRFRRIFGDPATRQIIFSAARVPAPRAYELGAVNTLSVSGGAREDALDLARRIAANAPLTIRAAKASLHDIAAGALAPTEQETALAAAADASADYAEGRAAFAEKRTPNFRGV